MVDRSSHKVQNVPLARRGAHAAASSYEQRSGCVSDSGAAGFNLILRRLVGIHVSAHRSPADRGSGPSPNSPARSPRPLVRLPNAIPTSSSSTARPPNEGRPQRGATHPADDAHCQWYRGALDERARSASSVSDFTLIPLAPTTLTTHIGLVATASTSYNEPFHVARKFASLDHLMCAGCSLSIRRVRGNVGWHGRTAIREVR